MSYVQHPFSDSPRDVVCVDHLRILHNAQTPVRPVEMSIRCAANPHQIVVMEFGLKTSLVDSRSAHNNSSVVHNMRKIMTDDIFVIRMHVISPGHCAPVISITLLQFGAYVKCFVLG